MSDTVIRPSFMLFLDGVILSVTGWIFWLVISKLANPSEIGYATALLSLINLVTAVSTLGMEYPLLKSGTRPNNVFGTLLIFELLINAAILPAVYIVSINLYSNSLLPLIPVSLTILILGGIAFVSKHSLLGSMDTRNVVIIDMIALLAKFIAIAVVMINGGDALDILTTILVQQIITSALFAFLAYRRSGFSIADKPILKSILFQSMTNFPGKLSKFAIISLSTVLLALIGVNAHDVGLFYIALMIMTVLAALPASLFTMAIPAFRISQRDISYHSYRIGNAFMSPLICFAVTFPTLILAFLGPSYVEAEEPMVILAFSSITYIMVLNAITSQNNFDNTRTLIILGLIELLAFLSLFFPLSYLYETTGAALSVLIAFSASALYAIRISGRRFALQLIYSLVAIVGGWMSAVIASDLTANDYALFISIPVSITLILVTRVTTPDEMINVVKSLVMPSARKTNQPN